MHEPRRRRWRSAVALVPLVCAGVWLCGCLETTTPSEGQPMSSEIYLLVGINLAIFFGFTAIYAIMEARRRRKGVKGLDVGLKPQGAQNKSAGENPPKNAKLCGICNAPNPPNQKFCIECGFRL